MRVPVHRFCDLVLGFYLEHRDEDQRREIMSALDEPFKGEAKLPPSQAELDADYKAMMAFGAHQT